jgi:hypothetical protein
LKNSKLFCSLFALALISTGACSISLPDQPQTTTAHWQNPANYSRTPTGDDPVNPVTFAVDFTDQSGCPNQTYRFWLFSRDGGTPLSGIGVNTTPLFGSRFEQTAYLPNDEPVYQVRLVCTDASGNRYSNSTVLEQGDPAFTPRIAISWQTPDNYTRTPDGDDPVNPITFSAEFTDESGCLNQEYRFWIYDQGGSPVGGIGSVMAMEDFAVSTEATLPDGVPVYAVRLACVDGDGNIYDTTANLESGNPAFTPAQGTCECSGQNTTLCETPETSGDCATCGGYWAGPFCDGPYSGDCVRIATQEDCVVETFCDWDTDHCEYTGGQGFCGDIEAEGTCDSTPSCSWNTGVCVGQNTSTCVDPSDEETCLSCSGTCS